MNTGERGGGDFELTQTTHRRCFMLLGLIFCWPWCCPWCAARYFTPVFLFTQICLCQPSRDRLPRLFPLLTTKIPTTPPSPCWISSLVSHNIPLPPGFSRKKYLEYWKKDFYCLQRLLVASLSVLCHPASSRILGRGWLQAKASRGVAHPHPTWSVKVV